MKSRSDKPRPWPFSLKMGLLIVTLLSIWMGIQSATLPRVQVVAEIAFLLVCAAALITGAISLVRLECDDFKDRSLC